jgi:quercetin dioxygenase-like cupin family protein
MERDETQSVRPVDLRDYTSFDPERARRVRVMATDVLTVDLWCLEPRQATDALRYDEIDVCYTVLGGTAWFVTDEGELGLGPLGAMLVPAGVAHGIDNRTVDPVVILAAGSPPDVPAADVAVDEPVEDRRGAVRHLPQPGALTRGFRRLFGADRR